MARLRRISINTILLNTLWSSLATGEQDKAMAILTDIRAYQLLRSQAKELYKLDDKTQYKAIKKKIEVFVINHDLEQFMN